MGFTNLKMKKVTQQIASHQDHIFIQETKVSIIPVIVNLDFHFSFQCQIILQKSL